MTAYTAIVVLTVVLIIATGNKWRIKMRVVVPWAFFMGTVVWTSLHLSDRFGADLPALGKALLALFEAGIFTAAGIAIVFFRDPERTPPAADNIILSPADGTVVYVKDVRNGEFPFAVKGTRTIPLTEFAGDELIRDRGIQIGIGMSLTDVHVNRTPIGGRIVRIKRIPGGYFSLKHIGSLLENERVLTVIDGGGIRVGVVQIASRLVRRITSCLSPGDDVDMGQRMGMIRFGSQVDLLVPFRDTLRISVKPGDEVKAGVSIIATVALVERRRNARAAPAPG